MVKEEWVVGDKCEVDRIPTTLTGRNRSWLTVVSFDGDEDDLDPCVNLAYREMDGQNLAYYMMRVARLHELREVGQNVRISAGMRTVLGLEPVPCGCHCGENTSGAEFRQGHDARLKGALQRWANGKNSKGTPTDEWVRQALTPEGALKTLTERGWPTGKANT